MSKVQSFRVFPCTHDATRLSIALVLTAACGLALTSRVNAQAIDVQLSRTTSAAAIVTTVNTPITIPDAPSVNYDAADITDAGTTWNSLIAPTVTSNNTSGGNITFTTEQNLPLVNSLGAASSVTISSIQFTENTGKNDTIHQTGIVAGTDPGTDGLANNPSGLMAQSWFDNGTSESITFNLSGLTPSTVYNLYIYGAGTSNGFGGSFTAPAANRATGYNATTGAYTTEPTVAGINRSVFDSTGTNPTPEQGLSWVLLPVQADSSGNLSFSVNKDNGSGIKGSINGFQLDVVPEPSALALVGTGFGLMLMVIRRRRTS
jgi:hypothetical protein